MTKLAYVNGKFVSEATASLPIFDRSILFSDSVYEVICFLDGKFLDFQAHLQRLRNSLSRLNIDFTFSVDDFLATARQLIEQNQYRTGLVYLQVTRGSTDRDFVIAGDLQPNYFMFAVAKENQVLLEAKLLKLISRPDVRWGHCDIKTTQLLSASMEKSAAVKQGLDDVVLVKDGYITEASSANFYIVDSAGCIVTRDADGTILPGITRATLLNLAKKMGLKTAERPFTLEEALQAKEAFISSATSFIAGVVQLDGKTIGSGALGPMASILRAAYLEHVSRI
ncbi:aminotransferase class IV [Bartonella sp. TP]|uniref:aminotransferase class IV n=1 Tax=Bartonella sp. TP TaxID=3057550 RepID=UPI0025B0F5C0|nr:aminotransferase class IV [Bartonella sp. TP]WJW79547.1 aminotransferase class IV [Bartonella sp. TP]